MSTLSANPAELDLDGLIQSLPACKRCRECRRGCDTLLPKCKCVDAAPFFFSSCRRYGRH